MKTPEEFYAAASDLARRGEDARAATVFLDAFSVFPNVFGSFSIMGSFQGADFDAPTTRAFYTALAQKSESVRRFLTPCPILGHGAFGSAELSDDILQSVFSAHLTAWEKAGRPNPPNIDVYAEDAKGRPAHVLYVGAEYINCSPQFIRSDLTIHVLESLREFGCDADFFPADNLFYAIPEMGIRDRPTVDAELARLRAMIRETRPECLIVEGGFSPGEGTVTSEDLARLKAELTIPVVVLLTDLYPPHANYAMQWAGFADLVVTYCAAGGYDEEFMAVHGRKKLLIAPSVPFPRGHFQAADQRSAPTRSGLTYVGSRSRYRDLWCAFAAESDVPCHFVFTNRKAEHSPTQDAYYSWLMQSKMVLNNGSVSADISIMTARFYETLWCGALPLQEYFSGLNAWFLPYIHYVPFRTVDQMNALAGFLDRREDWRGQIAERGQDLVRRYYNADGHWRTIFSRLGF